MEYREFVSTCKQKLENTLGEGFIVKETEVRKNNSQTYVGLTITTEESNVVPAIYLEVFYDAYNKGTDIEEIVNELVRIYSQNRGTITFDVNEFTDWNWVKDHVCYKLVSKSMNEELLKDVPHRDFLDLAVVYYAPIETEGNFQSITIKNQHLAMWGKKEYDLYRRASKNTPKMFSDVVINLGEMFGEGSLPMYVVSNNMRIFGASTMLYTKLFETLASRFEDDVIIFPSSIHEIIAVPAMLESRGNLKEMVECINNTEVAREEVLSNNVYKYIRSTGDLKIA